MSLNFRVAARGLARTPGFFVSTVVTLALGMGVATAIFSLVSAILLREAPAHEPDRLVNVRRTAKDGSSFHAFSSLDLRDLRESAGRSFASLAAFSSTVVSLRQAESLQAAELLSVQVTSANYFEALGVAPLLGRAFLPADDTPGTSTVLLSERLWRRRFGASREVLGSAVTLNGLPYTVVGIVPARFTGTFVGFAFDLWVPLSAPAAGAPPDALTNPAADWLEVFGRLAPGVSREAAQASLSIAASTISREHPKGGEAWGVDVRAMTPVDDSLRAVVTRLFALLLIVSGLVLGIACINVAGLLLARGAARRREMAIRQAIGAGTGALARQLLAETVLLFGSGSLLGGFLAWWLSGALLAFSPKYAMPLELDVAPGPFVLFVAVLATAVTGLVFGLLPALRAARVDLVPALKEGRNEARPALVGARSLFVVAQVAATMLLLVAAGLLVKSIDRIRKADAGFDPTGVRMTSIDFGLVRSGRVNVEALQRDLLARAAALPGVTSAALVRSVPLGGFGPRTGRVEVEGLTAPTREGFEVFLGTASPGSFETLRIPLLSGRDFRASDDASAPRVAVVNETFASCFWPGESALGRRFLVESQAVEVIGVARAGKYKSLMEEPRPYVTVPLAQNPSRRMTLLLRTETGATRRRRCGISCAASTPTSPSRIRCSSRTSSPCRSCPSGWRER